ncbi:alpha/beta fold hydrolase [Planotetraspora kaengkrachanensis]|uniref:Alpha/beta hydrolase n=1 Tax=Planotetraspora kaengkrachanensis TaxID=575193 RepID=A0A8J3V989_9ACTN|nr:alpha/beta hydrolase [Planotetraspora kaengkrachanensis]GIG82511.1 alpha/beta hydrolase [Planotetraspora kaengkrachanensis]
MTSIPEEARMLDRALGTRKTVTLRSGRVAYTERGSGPPVVFVHGLLANANLWRKVVPPVADAGLCCIAPDWPLGAHQIPMPAGADLTPSGVARLIAEFLDALDLTDVTVVANDTGGALTQILMADHPERLGRVVLTPCDAFEDFLPDPFTSLPKLARLPGAVCLAGRLLRLPIVQRRPSAFGRLAKRGIPAEIIDSYLRPSRDSRQIRRDTKRFIVGVHNRYTLAAAETLSGFGKPVLLVRAEDDQIFSARLFERLAATLPDARLVTVADSYAFVPEDQPSELARLIVEFAA